MQWLNTDTCYFISEPISYIYFTISPGTQSLSWHSPFCATSWMGWEWSSPVHIPVTLAEVPQVSTLFSGLCFITFLSCLSGDTCSSELEPMEHQAPAWRSWLNRVIMPNTWESWWQYAEQWFGAWAVPPAPGVPGPDELTELRVWSHPVCKQQDAGVLLCKRHPTICHVLDRSASPHSCVTAQTQLLCACVAVNFPEVVPPAWNCVHVWGKGSRFPVNGVCVTQRQMLGRSPDAKPQKFQTRALVELFLRKQWTVRPKPQEDCYPLWRQTKENVPPALVHKPRDLVVFCWQCSWLPGWESRWRRNSASLSSHATFVSRIVVIGGTSSKSLLKPMTV